jgi:predicted Zn-dependent protease
MTAETATSPDLLQRVLSFSTAEQAEVSLADVREASTRFANNSITQNVAKRTAAVTVRSIFGQRAGKATTTDLSEAGLRECVSRAEALARESAPDPELLPLPGPQSYPSVVASDERITSAQPMDRAAGVGEAIGLAEASGLTVAGSYATDTTLRVLVNSAGLLHQQALTEAEFVITGMTEDSSGWATAASHRLSGVDPRRCAEIAIQKAQAARDPGEIDPGEYTVVLEPAAAADFFAWFGWTMDARAAHEGRSAFAGKEGERVGVPGIRFYSQADHPEVPTSATSEDGLAAPNTAWIDDGVLQTLSYGRYWAEKTGHAFTGRPANLIMEGGNRSLEELIGSVQRGVLVTRFWYIRFVDPMKLLLTGMTRDGLFLIEDGQITRGLKNMRFNESPLRCLERVSALGRQTRVGRWMPCYMPAMKIEGFRFTSGTSF